MQKSTQNELKADLRPKNGKLLEENIGSKILDAGLGNDFFFYLTPKAKATKAKNKPAGLH